MADEADSGADDNELNIARRTRSHMRIDDFVLNDNLDFPDVDRSLYQDPNSEVDTEYKNFLNQCFSIADSGGEATTDDNDPAYVYNDDIFSHGWRFNLDEELRVNEQVSVEQQNLESKQKQSQETNVCPIPANSESSNISSRRRIEMFDDPEFARVLDQQLRQHIQLLTQSYLLTKNTTNMQDEADEAKAHLESYMKVFKNKSKPLNLLPAMELVSNIMPTETRSSIRLTWRPIAIPDPIKKIFETNPKVFLYKNLLPQVAFSIVPNRKNSKPRINFTHNEDKLLAYALHEFKNETSQYAFIASLLMTAKTKMQISNHIKNIKRSPGNENNPIKLYFSQGILPQIDLDSDAEFRDLSELKESDVHPLKDHNEENNNEQRLRNEKDDGDNNNNNGVSEGREAENHVHSSQPGDPTLQITYPDHDEMMNMDLDDLMAASTTISKSTMATNGNSNSESKIVKNLLLKKPSLNFFSHKNQLSQDMADLIINEFLKTAQKELIERNYLQLLDLLANLLKTHSKRTDRNADANIVDIYREISKFLLEIAAPSELSEMLVLFLDLNQANKCGCAVSYLHWMRFFEFMEHVEQHHDSEVLEKKLVRLIDALQRNDSNRMNSATASLVSKHPDLKRGFESLSLDAKPPANLFENLEDFDDITEPMSKYFESENVPKILEDMFEFEHFESKVTQEESNYATQSCPCSCHLQQTNAAIQIGQHCGRCNLKFMRGKMYLVNKIKPILAEWSYTKESMSPQSPAEFQQQLPRSELQQPQQPPLLLHEPRLLEQQQSQQQHQQPILLQQTQEPPILLQQSHLQQQQQQQQPPPPSQPPAIEWSYEEDKEILEFCRVKAEQHEESISFDASTFEELANKRKHFDDRLPCKKSAHDIAERFNQLMGMYKDKNFHATL